MLSFLMWAVMAAATVAAGVVVYWLYAFRVPGDDGRLPPGPPVLPLIGNLREMFRTPNPSLLFHDLAKKYGPVVSLRLPGGLLVAVNDHKSVHDALVGQGDQFNHRSKDMVLQLVGTRGVLGADGDAWKEHRKLLARVFRDNGVGRSGTEAKVRAETRTVVEYLKGRQGNPTDIHEPLAQTTFNIINWVTTGQSKCPDPSMFRHLLESTEEAFTLTFASAFNYMPWLPIILTHGQRLWRAVSNFKELETATKRLLHHQGRRAERDTRGQQEVARPDEDGTSGVQGEDNLGIKLSIVDAYYEEQAKNPNSPRLSVTEIEFVARDVFCAGMETSLYTTQWTLIALACLPDIQERMYQELKQCTTETGQISPRDRARLRYTEAVIQEALRWSRVVPILAHAAVTGTSGENGETNGRSKDHVEFRGYRFPAGTPFYVNLYSLLRDEAIWERPDDFHPEHFYDHETGQLRNTEKNLAFSVGKRSCLGEALARQEIFHFLTEIILNFNVTTETPLDLHKLEGQIGMTWRPPRIELVYNPRDTQK